MEERRRINAPAIACVIIVIAVFVVYVGGYFALSDGSKGATSDDRRRIFSTQWLTQIYKPAARVESAITGDSVSTYWMPPTP